MLSMYQSAGYCAPEPAGQWHSTKASRASMHSAANHAAAYEGRRSSYGGKVPTASDFSVMVAPLDMSKAGYQL